MNIFLILVLSLMTSSLINAEDNYGDWFIDLDMVTTTPTQQTDTQEE